MQAISTTPVIEYHKTSEIKDNHWAIQPNKDDIILVITVGNGAIITVKVNPTDSRGLRTIAQYMGNGNGTKETLNRRWTSLEMDCLSIVVNMMVQIYYDLGLTPQYYFAGNNSMKISNGKVVIGENEPSMLHVHVLGRGIPGHCYFQDLPFEGPAIGDEFSLKGPKVPWNSQTKECFRNFMQEKLAALCKASPHILSWFTD